MLFGADKLPEIARGLGKGMRQIKDATNDIKREIKNSAEKHDIDIDIASNVRKEINKVKDNIGDFNNFQVTDHSLYLYGYCEKCLE